LIVNNSRVLVRGKLRRHGEATYPKFLVAAPAGPRQILLAYALLATLAVTDSSAAAGPTERIAQDSRPATPSEDKSSPAKSDKSSTGANGPVSAAAQKPQRSGPHGDTSQPADKKALSPPFDIDEYRVEGADSLPQIEVEQAVYPFLGPNRTSDDVEKARAALEKAYHDKGYQTVTVAIPQQRANRGFVVLKVTENRVGRLRVKGSRYFDLDTIKSKAVSLQEGKLPNLDAVTKDIVALNRWPDRHVTPALRAGVTPGTVDVDLNVEDTFPWHGSAEFNNRQSPNTTPLRFTGTARYDNLWQLGHSLSYTYLVAPQRPADALVHSVSYLARTDLDWLDVLIYGLNSASSVATIGGANVVGPGTVVGTRGVFALPTTGQLFHTISLGFDFKRFGEMVAQGSESFSTPVTYVPIVGAYGATWQGDGYQIQLNSTVTASLRGLGSLPAEFDAKRFKATANFITLRPDVSYTRDLKDGWQLFLKGQGQVADQPLVSSEQLSLGGLDTVRGYLESEVLGDFGGSATVELRSPNFAPYFAQTLPANAKGESEKFNPIDEWKVFAFTDIGRVRIFDPLPEQQEQFDLASYGFGTRLKIMKYGNGLFLVGVPLTTQQVTIAHKPRVIFRVWGEF
jgi:hemolysin activation/secretion protein